MVEEFLILIKLNFVLSLVLMILWGVKGVR